MQVWAKYVLSFGVPLMVFMVTRDTAAGFYGPDRHMVDSYVVSPVETAPAPAPAAEAEIEVEAAPEPEVEVAEEPAAPVVEEDTAVAEAPAEEAVEVEADAEVEMDEARMTLIAQGEAAARTCSSCHQLERERNGVGPHLVGLANRAIGGVDGFRYSSALQDLNAEGAVWTEEELEIWLADPSAYAPGTAMGYAVDDPEDRAAIAAWLVSREQE